MRNASSGGLKFVSDAFKGKYGSARNGLLKLNVENEVIALINDELSDSKSRKKRNKMSFTMKKVPEAHAKSSGDSSSKGETKISSFSCRADVIYKKILRDFRRYYINDFQEITNFKNCKKGQGREFIIRCLEEYSLKRFGKIANKDQVIFALGSLVAPSELTRLPSANIRNHARRSIRSMTLFTSSVSQKLINCSMI